MTYSNHLLCYMQAHFPLIRKDPASRPSGYTWDPFATHSGKKRVPSWERFSALNSSQLARPTNSVEGRPLYSAGLQLEEHLHWEATGPVPSSALWPVKLL